MMEEESNKEITDGKDAFGPFPVLPTAMASTPTPLVAVPVLHDEEYATELTEPSAAAFNDNTRTISRAWGWSALVVSILSLFVMPVLFGTAGVILGIIAFFRGNRSLGGWSMAISLVSIFTSFILVPLFT
jgi:hypothetical protein